MRRIWQIFVPLAERVDLESSFGRILQAVSDSISAGNLKVFAEVAPIFVQAIRTFHQDVEHDADKLESFLGATLRPGATEAGGQDHLREAFTHYYEAMFEPSAKRKAEINPPRQPKGGAAQADTVAAEHRRRPECAPHRGCARRDRSLANALSRFLPNTVATRAVRG